MESWIHKVHLTVYSVHIRLHCICYFFLFYFHVANEVILCLISPPQSYQF